MTNTGPISVMQQHTPRDVHHTPADVHPTPRDVHHTPRDAPLPSHRTQQHEAYIENRLLTPTRFRPSPSLPQSDPLSPKREFGVQTGISQNTGI